MSEAQQSKMGMARELYHNLNSNAENLETSVRQAFISEATSKVGLTNSGAASYYQMVKTESEGGDPYKHHTSRSNNTGKTATVNEDDAWGVFDGETLVASAPNRDKARATSKELGGGYAVAKR